MDKITKDNTQSHSSTTSAKKTKHNEYICSKYFVEDLNMDNMVVKTEEVHQYSYVCNRPNNAGFHLVGGNGKDCNGVQIKVSERQLYGLRRDIFNQETKILFNSLDSKYMKEQFVVNLIIDNHLQNNILKFDENQRKFFRLPMENIFQYVYDTLSRKSNKGKKRVSAKNRTEIVKGAKSKTPKDSSQVQETRLLTSYDKAHPLNCKMKFGKYFYRPWDLQNEWYRLLFHGSKDEKLNYNSNDYVQEKSHALFSVIHPLFEDYEFILFNGSHRLRDPPNYNEHTLVHEGTRIRVKMPGISATNSTSYFIIFDSKLVHCGAKAKRESMFSQSKCKCMRLFSYVYQSFHGTQDKLSLNQTKGSSKNDDDSIIQYMRTDMFDRSSFRLCDSLTCELCRNVTVGQKNHSSSELVIDISREATAKRLNLRSTTKLAVKENMNKTANTTTSSSSIHPESYICGDLDIHGWEVHTGIDTMSVRNKDNKFRFLNYHLENLLMVDRLWKGISMNAGRSYLKLVELDETTREHVKMSKKFILNKCFPEISNIISNIQGFKNHNMHGNLILANRGNCKEQIPHKDYKKGTDTNNIIGQNDQTSRSSKRQRRR